ncbi:hypothetical protein ACLB2K_020184 [Fragaria x ananassa]
MTSPSPSRTFTQSATVCSFIGMQIVQSGLTGAKLPKYYNGYIVGWNSVSHCFLISRRSNPIALLLLPKSKPNSQLHFHLGFSNELYRTSSLVAHMIFDRLSYFSIRSKFYNTSLPQELKK